MGRSGPILRSLLGLTLIVAPASVAAAETAGERFERYEGLMRSARIALDDDRLDEARNRFTRALELADSYGPGNLRTARALDGLGDASRLMQRHDEAAAFYEQAATLWSKLLGSDQPALATTWHNLGAVELDRGNFARARRLFRDSRAIWTARRGEESVEVLISLEAEATALQREGRFADAEPLIERARALRRARSAANDANR